MKQLPITPTGSCVSFLVIVHMFQCEQYHLVNQFIPADIRLNRHPIQLIQNI